MSDVINILNSISPHDLKLIFLYMFPDSILIFYVALKLYGRKINWAKIIISSIILAPFNLILREIFIYYNMPFSIISVVIACIFALFLIAFYKYSLIQSIISSLIIYSLTTMGDSILFKVMTVFNLTTEQIFSSVSLNALMGFVEMIYVIILAFILTFTKFNLDNIMK